jgi:hypothetical protein
MQPKDPTTKKVYKLKRSAADVVETTERSIIQAKYQFSDQEKTEIAAKLAQRQIELVEKQDEKKTVLASFTDALKRISLDISKLSRGYRDGWEYREYECVISYDYTAREKIYKEAMTGEVKERKPFGPGDDQRRIGV